MEYNNEHDNQHNLQLTNETFERIMKEYIEQKAVFEEVENQRTDHKLNQLSWTNLWLFIIALYCFWNLLCDLIPIILGVSLIQNLINHINAICL